jgi:hypothetical protein
MFTYSINLLTCIYQPIFSLTSTYLGDGVLPAQPIHSAKNTEWVDIHYCYSPLPYFTFYFTVTNRAPTSFTNLTTYFFMPQTDRQQRSLASLRALGWTAFQPDSIHRHHTWLTGLIPWYHLWLLFRGPALPRIQLINYNPLQGRALLTFSAINPPSLPTYRTYPTYLSPISQEDFVGEPSINPLPYLTYVLPYNLPTFRPRPPYTLD